MFQSLWTLVMRGFLGITVHHTQVTESVRNLELHVTDTDKRFVTMLPACGELPH